MEGIFLFTESVPTSATLLLRLLIRAIVTSPQRPRPGCYFLNCHKIPNHHICPVDFAIYPPLPPQRPRPGCYHIVKQDITYIPFYILQCHLLFTSTCYYNLLILTTLLEIKLNSPYMSNMSHTSYTRRKNCNSALWNAMVSPLRFVFSKRFFCKSKSWLVGSQMLTKRNRGLAVKGFLWYQGEANTHSDKR